MPITEHAHLFSIMRITTCLTLAAAAASSAALAMWSGMVLDLAENTTGCIESKTTAKRTAAGSRMFILIMDFMDVMDVMVPHNVCDGLRSALLNVHNLNKQINSDQISGHDS